MVVKAIRPVFLYYISGIFITLVVHLLVGWDSRVLMPRSILVIIFFMLAALPWFFINLTNLLVPRKRAKNLQELFVHCVFLTLILTLITTIN